MNGIGGREGRTVVVGKGSAYDLYLTRELRHATIVHALTSPTVVDTFVERNADVAAGVKQQLEADAQRIGACRLLPGRFMVIEQAMGNVAESLLQLGERARGAMQHRSIDRHLLGHPPLARRHAPDDPRVASFVRLIARKFFNV